MRLRDSLQITRCQDPLLWYANRIDQVFEVLDYDALTGVYWVATENGRNIVHETDCEHWDLSQAYAALDDPVNRPNHYNSGSIECIEAISAQLSKEGYQGYCHGNAAKYLWRWKLKGGVESLRKAQWYIDELITSELILELEGQ